MNLNTYKDYISGKRFSNALRVKLGRDEFTGRLDLITSIVKGKTVLHIGCVDHGPELINAKLKKDRWLHKLVVESSSKCTGVDIDAEGIKFIRTKFENYNLIAGDFFEEKTAAEINKDKWDYMVMGEILEHIENPVDFLKRVTTLYRTSVKNVIITVPNAFSLSNVINAFRNTEMINSDHYYWFTPYTLSRVINKAAMTVEDIHICHYFNKSNLGLKHKILHPISTALDIIKDILKVKIPVLRESLVVIAKF